MSPANALPGASPSIALYAKGSVGQDACPSGYEPILHPDTATCEAAAAAFGYPYYTEGGQSNLI